ncbi:MAG: hypothetical protein UT42_C0030G0004 [Candidatus Falkowbacteria bacterium GW2011_GWA2_39_24]|uniref:Uncharacterized protein n=1 Tax=Candidatus Falkowbacteria bacterium GW2011_GWA2_39_24 TaxID=1618634 RepID=A0A0G0RL27_9BACT|nr:MAG: hypothetical protein UT22_C0043G0004 [Parcubacteria group bacterium GW2011_GWC2_39_11]KKR14367.1 MAG: hypothetical protein UT42_C0030G0004 [Candidatus Falkowbacteria bacterium GW2011_GWA2_39_24]
MEIVAYIAVLAIIIGAVSSLFLWTVKIQKKARAIQEITDNARVAMRAVSQEVNEAEDIYLPTSIFDSDSGQLSLETGKHLDAGETSSFLDFYLCGDALCLKEEGKESTALTSDKIKVNKLKFTKIITGGRKSVEIELNIGSKSDAQVNIDLISTASLRNY